MSESYASEDLIKLYLMTNLYLKKLILREYGLFMKFFVRNLFSYSPITRNSLLMFPKLHILSLTKEDDFLLNLLKQ